MTESKEFNTVQDSNDPIDSYFECITTCSMDTNDTECESRCVEIHLKEDST